MPAPRRALAGPRGAGRHRGAQRAHGGQILRRVCQKHPRRLLGHVHRQVPCVGLRPHPLPCHVGMAGAFQRLPPSAAAVDALPCGLPQRVAHAHSGHQLRPTDNGGHAHHGRLRLVCSLPPPAARRGGALPGRHGAAHGPVFLVCLCDGAHGCARPLRLLAVPAAAHPLRVRPPRCSWWSRLA